MGWHIARRHTSLKPRHAPTGDAGEPGICLFKLDGEGDAMTDACHETAEVAAVQAKGAFGVGEEERHALAASGERL